MNELITVALSSEIGKGTIKCVPLPKEVGDIVIVANVDSRWYVFSESCPHLGGHLSRGDFHKDSIICPLHQYEFDVRTGENLFPSKTWPPAMRARIKAPSLYMYTVTMEGDEIKIPIAEVKESLAKRPRAPDIPEMRI